MKARLVSHASHASLLALLLAAVGCMSAAPSGGNTNVKTGSGGHAGSSSSGSTGSGGTRVTTGAGGGTVVTTGTGGSTGAGGSGTTGPVQKLCATKTTLMQPVLINFETYDGTVTADKYGTAFGGATPNTGTAYTGPYSYGDGSVTPTLAIMAGHPPSNWAVSQSVMQTATWGMGGGIWMSCANASAYKGISFWVRGSSTLAVFSFTVDMESTIMPDATNPAGGGTCTGTTATCLPAKKADIPLTADWTQVTIMWADFTPGMSGTTAVVPDGNNITGLGWNVPLQFMLAPGATDPMVGPYVPVPGDLLINIDDVQFIP